ncbi:arylsulfatase regulator (Fe-S oxidoreductase) [Paenibacillus terrae HPL-003]|uniref:Arylsulfatase regulator (Fe-S oxidoreductase) n=1 Tax=Paenibacillus terrae (strain HPL-003) TaxID=985665 RepID=G7W1R1_PAETH|nr:arylsulfatase regulator [Paenibacillus terrae]AET58610.1 arylsulfatase regulator (Fe-S oxidoreductase) [Paenibacillus terrae HPL-003]
MGESKAKDYYVQIYFRMFHYRKPSAGMPLEAHHGGPCVPGVQRLFADVNGNLYPCERVSEQSEVVQIGNVGSGFDVDKISQILNVGTITEDACKICWNFRFCTLCVAVADDLHTLSREMKLNHCSVVKNDVRHTLLDFCMLNELGYDFSDDTIALVRNLNLLGRYSEVALISFKGSGMIGKDACVADKGTATGLTVKPESCLEQELEQCDDVLLVRSNFKLDITELYLPLIIKAMKLGKKVMCNFILPDECMNIIDQYRNHESKLTLKNTFDIFTKGLTAPDPASVFTISLRQSFLYWA